MVLSHPTQTGDGVSSASVLRVDDSPPASGTPVGTLLLGGRSRPCGVLHCLAAHQGWLHDSLAMAESQAQGQTLAPLIGRKGRSLRFFPVGVEVGVSHVVLRVTTQDNPVERRI